MFALPSKPAKRAALIFAAVFYVGVGITHFTHVDFFLRAMPHALPAHLELVWLSGVFEILGGLGLLVKATRRFSSYGLILLLVAVFPANIHMAMHANEFADLGLTPVSLLVRLPFQFALMAWAYWIGVPDA